MTTTDVAVSTWEGERVDTWRARWRIPCLDILARINSTNDAARRLADAGSPAGTVVLADEQIAGRGRYGRSWHAPPGRALLMSVVLRPGAPAGNAQPGTSPVRVALAVARAIEQVAGITPGLKWPNDIVLPGYGKVAGILCEGSIAQSGDGFVIAGIGINTGQTKEDFAPAIRDTATSLLLATGGPVDRARLAGSLLDLLRPFDLRGLDDLGADEIAEFDRRDVLRGRFVHVDGTAAGIAAGLAPDAALLIDTADGIRSIHNGTVRLRGAAGYPAASGGRDDDDLSTEHQR